MIDHNSDPVSPIDVHEEVFGSTDDAQMNAETARLKLLQRRAAVKKILTITGLTSLVGIPGGAYLLKPLPSSSNDNWMADTGITLSQRSAQLQKLTADFDAYKKQIEERYRENGALPENIVIVSLFRTAELIEQLRTDPTIPVRSLEDYLALPELTQYQSGVDKNYHQNRLERGVGEKQPELSAKEQQSPTLKSLADLKLAMHQQLGEENFYNSDFSSTCDLPLHQRLQCRSGSMEFLSQALLGGKVQLQEGEELICIYQRGHVLPGLLTATGEVIGLEMTLKGTALVPIGPLSFIHGEMGIARAHHILLQSALNAQAHPSLVWLKKPEISQIASGKVDRGAEKRPNFSKRDRFSFGESPLPVEKRGKDLPMQEQQFIPASVYKEGKDIQETASTNMLELRLQEIEESIAKFPTGDQKIAREYFDHMRYFLEIWYTQVGLLNPILEDKQFTISEEEFAKRMNLCMDLNTAGTRFFKQNGLPMKRHRAVQVFKKHEAEFPEDPQSIAEKIVHNVGLALSCRKRALQQRIDAQEKQLRKRGHQ